MKKLISIITILICAATMLSAQDGEKKVYIPQSGDIAFGIDLSPVLQYAGNLFNGNTNNSLDKLGGEPVSDDFTHMDITPDVSIMAKYMISREFGLRVNLGLLNRTYFDQRYVQDDKLAVLDPFNETKLIDSRTNTRHGASLSLGGEYRVGKNRVQGVFNFGVLAGFQYGKSTYEYANAVTSINQQPSSAFHVHPAYSDTYRVLESRNTSNTFVGLTGGIGVECFVAPKVSLGAEVNLCAYYVFGGQLYTQSEGYNTSTEKVEVRTDLDSPRSGYLNVSTDNIGGSLFMAFYF